MGGKGFFMYRFTEPGRDINDPAPLIDQRAYDLRYGYRAKDVHLYTCSKSTPEMAALVKDIRTNEGFSGSEVRFN
jgi:hypothetical protein